MRKVRQILHRTPQPAIGSPIMKIADALQDASILLSRLSAEDARQNAHWLLGKALKANQIHLLEHLNDELKETVTEHFFELVHSRAAGKPLQYLLGTQEFLGREFEVTTGVLIPRPETELLVEVALAKISDLSAIVVDVGTGSGCIAISIALEKPEAKVFALDISREALMVAERNASLLGANNVVFLQGDLLAPLRKIKRVGEIDVILSNPPYVANAEIGTLQPEVKCWEPRVALAAGSSGTAIFERLVPEATKMLKMSGWFVAEIGYNIEEQVRGLFDHHWRLEMTRRDFNNIPRVIAAQKL